ncbi:MAG: CBS domain-containing protein [Candidatus Diapherotrites archaeon]|nr:CBS domain-containing protein [Candidatus Diapherotrites archaeon]
MPEIPEKNGDAVSFFLTEVLGRRVMFNGKRIGRLVDILVKENGKIPIATDIYVKRPFGNPSLLIPVEKADFSSGNEITARIDSIKKFEGRPDEKTILLKDYVLDKKVLDLEDREVDIVYDIKLVFRDGKLYVSEVDLSRYGFLKRIGLKKIADLIYGEKETETQTVSWSYIQPLPEQIGSFEGNIKLNVLKERLSELPPVDLADILEELGNEQRVAIFNELGTDTEHASETLQEINPSVQRALIASLNKKKVAKLIDVMTPGQAADILSILPFSDTRTILGLLGEDHAEKIKSILGKHDEKILNYTTTKYIRVGPDEKAKSAQEDYYKLAKGKKVVMYLYVLDEQRKLLGVIDIQELLRAKARARLKDVMVKDVISMKPNDTLKDAAILFSKYEFRALPVVDKKERMMGVVPYKDVIGLKHLFLE